MIDENENTKAVTAAQNSSDEGENVPEDENSGEATVIVMTEDGGEGSKKPAGGNDTDVIFDITSETTAPETEPETQREPEPLTMVFAGDILFDAKYAVMASLLERSGGNPDITKAFDGELLSIMRDADIFMVNNEFPYSERGAAREGKMYTFRAKPSYVSLLNDMGVDIAALANNHMFDYGEDALLDTLDILKEAGIPYAGAGRNIEEASAPVFLGNEDIRVGFLSATQIERYSSPDTRGATAEKSGVFRCFDPSLLIEKIKETKENCDFVVVYVHWGTESTDKLDDSQKKLAKSFREAGADLIIGDHPHVLQGISYEDGVPCIYSLGNYWFNSKSQDTCLVSVTIDPETKGVLEFKFIPARQQGCRTFILKDSEKQRVISYMNSISSAVLDEEGVLLTGGAG
ncbi:MAG: CapA family protein [Eubacteriales bacterium]|nr:CapA family protein [Eubacteriales bacterium]